jgi:hypothetical protein
MERVVELACELMRSLEYDPTAHDRSQFREALDEYWFGRSVLVVAPTPRLFAEKFWEKLLAAWNDNSAEQAVFLCKTEHLVVLQRHSTPPTHFPVCFLREPALQDGKRVSIVAVWLPPMSNKLTDLIIIKRFSDTFGGVGSIVLPYELVLTNLEQQRIL